MNHRSMGAAEYTYVAGKSCGRRDSVARFIKYAEYVVGLVTVQQAASCPEARKRRGGHSSRNKINRAKISMVLAKISTR